VASGILTYSKFPFIKRPPIIYQDISDLISQFRPDETALEALIYVKSVPALAKLAQARGAIIAALNDLVFEYAPNLIKSSITGYGHAQKSDIEKQLTMFYGKVKFKSFDETDALAIATTHALLRDNKLCSL
jgi:crossover junction endodeoxyribonuclease RuvC